MIDFFDATDEKIRIPDVPPRLQREVGGERVCRATVDRWWMRGILLPSGERAYLQTIKLGSKRYTSIRALRHFVAQTTSRESRAVAEPTDTRQREIVAAQREAERRFGVAVEARKRRPSHADVAVR